MLKHNQILCALFLPEEIGSCVLGAWSALTGLSETFEKRTHDMASSSLVYLCITEEKDWPGSIVGLGPRVPGSS